METLLLMVTIASTLVGMGMSVALWRSTEADRQHAAARVETLRRLAFSDGTPAMFISAGEPGAGKRRGVAVAAVAAAMMSIAGAAFALHDPEPTRTVRPAVKTLELLALRHSTDDRGNFVVTGEVQGARESAALVGVSAGVELLDQLGRRVASQQTAIAVGVLHAGEMSSFKAAFPHARGVATYHVQFRLADGSLVRHIDHRAASAGDTLERTQHARAN